MKINFFLVGVLFAAFSAQAEDRSDDQAMAILKARIAREEQTEGGAIQWHGKVTSQEVVETDGHLYMIDTHEDGFIRRTAGKKVRMHTAEDWKRLLDARKDALKRSLNTLGPGAPRALLEAQSKAVDEMDKVVTNTVVTTIGGKGASDAKQ